MPIELSLFTCFLDQRRFNPYLRVGHFELCVDRDGVAFHGRRRSFGFIRGSGFWSASA